MASARYNLFFFLISIKIIWDMYSSQIYCVGNPQTNDYPIVAVFVIAYFFLFFVCSFRLFGLWYSYVGVMGCGVEATVFCFNPCVYSRSFWVFLFCFINCPILRFVLLPPPPQRPMTMTDVKTLVSNGFRSAWIAEVRGGGVKLGKLWNKKGPKSTLLQDK